MSNGCPVCAGLGRVLAFGACIEPIPVPCPECAGLSITPASADDQLRLYTTREITAMLLRCPALPPAVCASQPEEQRDEQPEAIAGSGRR